MRLFSQSDAQLVQFLLGDLPETEATRIEERFFTDNELFERICALEEELIRDYLRGDLPAHMSVQFEERLRRSDELRRKTDSARRFVGLLARNAVEAPVPQRARSRFREFLHLLDVGTPRLALGVASVLAVAVVWVGVRNERLQIRLDELQATIHQSHRPVAVSFLLSPGLTRGASGEVHRLRIPAEAEIVDLRLEIGKREYPQYRADLRAAGDLAESWSGSAVPVRSGMDMPAVEIAVPAAAFRNADYVVRLSGFAEGRFEEIESYSFSVTGR